LEEELLYVCLAERKVARRALALTCRDPCINALLAKGYE
jgi:hypothetical protein